MSNDNDENLRRFRAFVQGNQNIQSEMSSSVPILTPREQQQQRLQQPQPVQRQQQPEKKKKKCRGNRKIQRYRRQLYAKGLDSETVNKLVEERLHPSQQQQQQQKVGEVKSEAYNIQNMQVHIPLHRITLPVSNNTTNDNSNNNMDTNIKRKRDFLATSTIRTAPETPVVSTSTSTISKSLSQLSISQGNPKKKKTITPDDQLNRANNESLMNSTENNKSHYLKVPNRIFKQLLSNAIDNGYKISQCLDTKEKLQFIRQITEITNNFYFKDLQRQLWQEYYNLSSKHDDNWELTVTKSYAHQHNTCRMYRPKKSFIEQRQATITHQLQRIGNALQENLFKLQQNTEQWQPSIDFNALSHAINECVKHGQQRLKDEFNYKKEMILLDWNDHRLITEFYKLKPNEEQIKLAKNIWQATTDELKTKEQLEILRQRIYLKRLPTKTDKMVNELLTDNQKTLSNPFLDQKQRASFASRCSKTIIQCKFNLMIVQIDEFETIIRRHHLTLICLQDQLSQLNKENPRIYTNLLMDTIEERRQAMIERFIRIRQHKLKTFFDEAPTVDDNN